MLTAFFSYNTSEALLMSTEQRQCIVGILKQIRRELQQDEDEHTLRTLGLPTVKFCAQELFLSPNYFGDLIRELTGKSATSHIRRFIMQRSQTLLLGGATISETAERLGFEYPQHLTRQFKKYFGITPSNFLNKN